MFSEEQSAPIRCKAADAFFLHEKIRHEKIRPPHEPAAVFLASDDSRRVAGEIIVTFGSMSDPPDGVSWIIDPAERRTQTPRG